MRNVKGSPSDRKKMTPDGNMDAQKNEVTGNGNYMGKHMRYFCII